MGALLAKAALSGVIIALVTLAAQRSTLLGALLASLPLTSILAFCWLYHDTGDVAQVAALARGILWLVVPSLVLFLVLPWLLTTRQVPFTAALGLACAATVTAYGVLLWALPRLGIEI